MYYYTKYLKYKNKYLIQQLGGSESQKKTITIKKKGTDEVIGYIYINSYINVYNLIKHIKHKFYNNSNVTIQVYNNKYDLEENNLDHSNIIMFDDCILYVLLFEEQVQVQVAPPVIIEQKEVKEEIRCGNNNPIPELIEKAQQYNELVEIVSNSSSHGSIKHNLKVNDRVLYTNIYDKSFKGTVTNVYPERQIVEIQTDEGEIICEHIKRFSYLITVTSLEEIKKIFESKLLAFEMNGLLTWEKASPLIDFNFDNSIKKISKAINFMSTITPAEITNIVGSTDIIRRFDAFVEYLKTNFMRIRDESES